MKDYLPLVRALIDALLLLESAGRDESDPDIAVRGMENISSSLHALEEADQRLLREYLLRIAAEADDESYGKFVRSLPDSLGLEPL